MLAEKKTFEANIMNKRSIWVSKPQSRAKLMLTTYNKHIGGGHVNHQGNYHPSLNMVNGCYLILLFDAEKEKCCVSITFTVLDMIMMFQF